MTGIGLDDGPLSLWKVLSNEGRRQSRKGSISGTFEGEEEGEAIEIKEHEGNPVLENPWVECQNGSPSIHCHRVNQSRDPVGLLGSTTNRLLLYC